MKNKQHVPCWILYSSNFWGRKSWESFLVNETFDMKQSLPCQKAALWGAHQEGSCESGILSFYIIHIKIKALLVSGSLVVNHAHWLQLLCPPCPWQWQAAMTSTPGDLYRSLTATSAQLRLRSPGWVWRRSQWRRCRGCYYPKLKSSKRCPKLTETDCFEQIQGWRWRLKTLSFLPIGFLSNLFCTNLQFCSICPNHLAPRVLHCPKAM